MEERSSSTIMPFKAPPGTHIIVVSETDAIQTALEETLATIDPQLTVSLLSTDNANPGALRDLAQSSVDDEEEARLIAFLDTRTPDDLPLLDQLKASQGLARLPVIALVPPTQDQLIAQAYDCRANAVILRDEDPYSTAEQAAEAVRFLITNTQLPPLTSYL